MGWYFQTPIEIMMSVAKLVKRLVIDQPLNESIVTSYYLLPPVNHNHLLLSELFFGQLQW